MQKKIILSSCYDCPHNSMIWMEDRECETIAESDEDSYSVRFGCLHKKMFDGGARENHGRLVSLTDSLLDRPDIPAWCPLEDA